jgi:Fe-S-cluster containining protein
VSESRLAELLDGLQAHADDPKVHLPVLQPEDAEAITSLFHAQIDRGTAARAAFVEKHGSVVACREGCSDCCRQVPAILAGEAVTIARWLERPEHADVKERFLARFPDWHEALKDLIGEWFDAVAAKDVERAAAAHAAMYRRGTMCTFNKNGSCTIYEVRPSICRTAHALDSNERCKPDATEPVRGDEYPPLDDYVVRIRGATVALHEALRADGIGALPLPIAVYEQLTRASSEPTR